MVTDVVCMYHHDYDNYILCYYDKYTCYHDNHTCHHDNNYMCIDDYCRVQGYCSYVNKKLKRYYDSVGCWSLGEL